MGLAHKTTLKSLNNVKLRICFVYFLLTFSFTIYLLLYFCTKRFIMKILSILTVLLIGILSCSFILKNVKLKNVKTLKISRLKRTNPDVFSYVNFIENSLVKKDLDTLISYCLSDHYQSQKELEISDEQFIYELFNISYPNAQFVDYNYSELIRATLSQINKVSTLRFIIPDRGILGDTYQFIGIIQLLNQQKVNFSFTLIELNKSFKIIGAIG